MQIITETGDILVSEDTIQSIPVSSRAIQFGRRKAIVEGAGSIPISLVFTTDTVDGDADLDRGVSDTESTSIIPVLPTPQLYPVTQQMITRYGAAILEGDYYFDVTTDDLEEADLQDQKLQVKAASDYFNVVLYDRTDFFGAVMFWRLFIRGAVQPSLAVSEYNS